MYTSGNKMPFYSPLLNIVLKSS